MGVLIEWQTPESESTYDTVRIWRSDSESGNYSLIHTQSISDNSYYDMNGTTSKWYKVTFYNSSTTVESSYSEAIQGGTFKGYCTPNDVRDTTNLTTDDITDAELYKVIAFAGRQLNADINTEVKEERVQYISNEKENDIDGSNTTFYTKKYPLGDDDGDMVVSTTDLDVYKLDSEGTRSSVTISSVTPSEGKFVVDTAPESTYDMYVSYKYTPLEVDDPHPMIRTACTLLSAAWAYSKINIGKAATFRVGSLNISRHIQSFDIYYQRYQSMLKEINARMPKSEETPNSF